MLYGSRTGRDGIGGASVLASQGFDEGSSDKRPSVQIGDPFMGKKLIECTLELLDRGLLASLQDLGAAGLACSTSEMAARGGVGLDVDLSRVPLRESDMQPFEIMISESQERMAAVVEPGSLDRVVEVCGRWEVDATVIGEVAGHGMLRAFFDGEMVGDMPVETLVDGAPQYQVPRERPARLADAPRAFAPAADPDAALRALLGVAGRGQQALGAPPVRSAGRLGHGRAAGRRRRRRAPDALAARDRDLAGRERPAHLARPPPRRHERGLRGRPQRCLHRRPAGGGDQLPELRQPGDG